MVVSSTNVGRGIIANEKLLFCILKMIISRYRKHKRNIINFWLHTSDLNTIFNFYIQMNINGHIICKWRRWNALEALPIKCFYFRMMITWLYPDLRIEVECYSETRLCRVYLPVYDILLNWYFYNVMNSDIIIYIAKEHNVNLLMSFCLLIIYPHMRYSLY
jgi:hypothetical protein